MAYLYWPRVYYQINSVITQCLYLEVSELIGLKYYGGMVRDFVYFTNALIEESSPGREAIIGVVLALPALNYRC